MPSAGLTGIREIESVGNVSGAAGRNHRLMQVFSQSTLVWAPPTPAVQPICSAGATQTADRDRSTAQQQSPIY